MTWKTGHPRRRRVHRGSTEVVLTGQELALLEAMLRRTGEVLSRDRLLHLAWDFAYEARSNVVDVCVRRLRSKLGFSLIKTVRGEGYQLAGR